MGLLRSERMKHGTLIIPSDRARAFINIVGKKTKMQFIDMNEASINRPYKRYIQRIDEMERIIRFLFEELSNLPNANVQCNSVESFLENDDEYTLDKVEQKLETLYHQFVKFKENNYDLIEQKNDAILEKNVALAATTQLRSGGTFGVEEGGAKKSSDVQSLSLSSFECSASEALLNNRELGSYDVISGQKQDEVNSSMTFSNVAGVILTSEQERFSRTLFRATRGNTYTHFQTIINPIMDSKTKNKLVSKSVFVIYYQGSTSGALYDKIIRICKAFETNVYRWPRTYEVAMRRVEELQMTIDDKQKALEAYEKFVMSEVAVLLELTRPGGNSLIEEWRLFAMKEKAIYAALNMFEGADVTLRADCWFPEDEEENIRNILMQESNEEQVTAFLLAEKGIPKSCEPPTYIRVTEFSSSFQNFVDTYGIPRYREANPALLTIVTFPFLFGVMYGDIGHGACLLIFALFLIYYHKRSGGGNSKGEMADMIIGGRYMILLMGFFAIYAGFLYNDFFSIGLNIFNSRWDFVQEKDKIKYWKPGDDFPYPFGFDPKWKGATNELMLTNSFKMKFSVIVGFAQMFLGLILKGMNALYFKEPLDFIFEFIPQVVFLCALVGYMDFLIIFKWVTSPSDYNKPMLITTIINMCMFGSVQHEEKLYDGQETLQKVLVSLMLISVPLMLFVKPLIKLWKHKSRKRKNMHRNNQNNCFQFSDAEVQLENIKNEDEEQNFDFAEEFVHKMIETIEFVLGTISNTASYLRLWALSLAHQQLALVFFQKTFILALNVSENLGIMIVALFLGFAVFAAITFAVMLCMDSLECFLHALRLQWVEFQNKFYKADGYNFEPLNFYNILYQRAA